MSNVNNEVIFRGFSGSDVAEIVIAGAVKRRLDDLVDLWGYVYTIIIRYGNELSKDDVLDQLRIVDEACERLLRGLTEETRVEVPEGYIHQGLSVNIDLPIVKEFVAKVRELQGKVEEFRDTL